MAATTGRAIRFNRIIAARVRNALPTTETNGFVPTTTANNMAMAGGTENYREVADGVALAAELEEIRKKVVTGDLRPVVDRVFGLDELRDAMRYFLDGEVRGKLVINVR